MECRDVLDNNVKSCRCTCLKHSTDSERDHTRVRDSVRRNMFFLQGESGME